MKQIISIISITVFISFVIFMDTTYDPEANQILKKERQERLNRIYQNEIITLVLHGDKFKVKKLY
jgi:hypothetical protein